MICRDANSNANSGLYISARNGVEAEFIVKGKVTFNSNVSFGMYSYLFSDSKLDIAVLNDATLESCGNTRRDISGFVEGAATFSGTGYTCDQTYFFFDGNGTVVEPVCQACPDP